MAIIPGQFCERCAETEADPVPAEHELDSWGDGSGGGGFLCGNCCMNAAEAAYERFLDDYYGGSGPVTIQEHYDAAVKERRELRKRD
jgi:hypothetical protein